MTCNTVTIYGASDDLIEFEGAFEEEFNVHGPVKFEVTISNETRGSYRPAECTTLWITAEFSGENGDWQLGVITASGHTGLDIEVEFTNRPGDEYDPAIMLHLCADDTVEVKKL